MPEREPGPAERCAGQLRAVWYFRKASLPGGTEHETPALAATVPAGEVPPPRSKYLGVLDCAGQSA